MAVQRAKNQEMPRRRNQKDAGQNGGGFISIHHNAGLAGRQRRASGFLLRLTPGIRRDGRREGERPPPARPAFPKSIRLT